MPFTPGQLVLLDNLIYLDAMTYKLRETVMTADIISEASSKGVSEADFPAVTGVASDPYLMSLRVTNRADTDANPSKENTGFRAAAFSDGSGDTAVIIRGTSGDYQWMDNAATGWTYLSGSQNEALEYMKTLADPKNPHNINGRSVVVSGHSKGGNLAAAALVAGPERYNFNITGCLALDAPGFSPEFIHKYSVRIAKNRRRLFALSSENDVVSGLFLNIADEKNIMFIKSNITPDTPVDNGLSHYIRDILDGSGKLNVYVSLPSAAHIFVRSFTEYVLFNVDSSDKIKIFNKLMGYACGNNLEKTKKIISTLIGLLDSFIKVGSFKIFAGLFAEEELMLKDAFDGFMKANPQNYAAAFWFFHDYINCGAKRNGINLKEIIANAAFAPFRSFGGIIYLEWLYLKFADLFPSADFKQVSEYVKNPVYGNEREWEKNFSSLINTNIQYND